MPNTFDPKKRVCARCGETRARFFGTSRSEVEYELAPVDGLVTVYLCKDCKQRAERRPASMQVETTYVMATRSEDDAAPSLSGPYDQKVFNRRYRKAH